MGDALPSPREPALRKRLGQFFTGERLARLVTALGGAYEAGSIIDPMGGAGDMLLAAASQSKGSRLHYLELDPEVADIAAQRFESRRLQITSKVGNAFDPRTWADMPATYDLVVTNPPYVRYQTGSSPYDDHLTVPDADSIRDQLIANLETRRPHDAFFDAARNYSGLADLAVPAWILCCARVSLGGRLAVLVPNTWLTRDYAREVLRLLNRFFEIECIVDDRDQSWFDDALVRTSIIVARRVEDCGATPGLQPHHRIALARDGSGPRSAVQKVFPESTDPDRAFAQWAQSPPPHDPLPHVVSRWSDGSDISASLDEGTTKAPEALVTLFGSDLPPLTTLTELGWQVGQGLRTGANDFFYVTPTDEEGLYTSPILPGERLRLPKAALRPTLRRQSELTESTHRVPDTPQTMTLVLEGWALPDDASTDDHLIEGDLARLVHTATITLGGKAPNKKPIPELSAVRTNVRPGRHWYQLPTLAPRHEPLLFIPRVNNRHPQVHLNPGREWLIDSNFSTLWPTDDAKVDADELLKTLSSPWALACMELMGNVMGGGALKLEATHLRRLPLVRPLRLNSSDISNVARLLRQRLGARHG